MTKTNKKTIYNLEELKKDMLKSLEENFENHFNNHSPQLQNKKPSLKDFNGWGRKYKDFCNNASLIYSYVEKQINEAETKKELDSIRINENMFNEAPF